MQVSAALIHEVLRAIEWSGTRVMRLSKPSLFIFAKQDRIIDPEAALNILLRHKKPELFEIETVESRWHNPCRDPEAESKVTKTIFNWYKRFSRLTENTGFTQLDEIYPMLGVG